MTILTHSVLLLVTNVAVFLLIVKVDAFPFVENDVAVVGKREVQAVKLLTNQTTDACKREGGFCLNTVECPAGKLSLKTGICDGEMECCHSLPDSIVDCSERGGICRLSPGCKGPIVEPLGRCPSGQVCCILVI